jgi:hypothetical protein
MASCACIAANADGFGRKCHINRSLWASVERLAAGVQRLRGLGNAGEAKVSMNGHED